MQATYRLKVQEISTTFLNSLKKAFAGQEVEIIVKSVETTSQKETKKSLLEMIEENRKRAPSINTDIDVRGLIDQAQYPGI